MPDARFDDGGVAGGEDAGAEKGPAGVLWRGRGVCGGGVVVSLP